ncbi:MAG: type II secretion system protein GspM [Mariprofundaceae bacterium]
MQMQDQLRSRFAQLKGEVDHYFQPWYSQLSQREQRLCIAMAILLPLMLLVLGVWRPLHHGVAVAERGLPTLEAQWQEAQALADRLQRGGNKKASTTASLSSLVEQAAKGVKTRQFLTRIKPQPTMGGAERLMLQFSSVPFGKLMPFLKELANAGITIQRAKMQKGSKAGIMNVTLLVVRE